MRLSWFFFGFAALALFLCDFFSKEWIYQNISLQRSSYFYPYGGIGVFKDFFGVDFSILHVANKAAAWGLFSSWQGFLPYLRMAFIVLLLWYCLHSKKFIGPLVFLITGAVGNVVDYFRFGYVLDMFYFRLWGYSFPVFNVADSLIFLGVVSFFLSSRRHSKNYDKSRSAAH